MSDLGVYVTTLNEENLIIPCLAPIKDTFEFVEVVDLGSRDSTLKKVKSLEVPIIQFKDIGGAEYTVIKEGLSMRHEWVFWVDGDEIYDEENLQNVYRAIGSLRYGAYRVAWKTVGMDASGQLLSAEPLVNGCKIFHTRTFRFHRGWPREVLKVDDHLGYDPKQPKEEYGIWCWHGKLLKRSSVVDTQRDKKRRTYPDDIKGVKWHKLDPLPWNDASRGDIFQHKYKLLETA